MQSFTNGRALNGMTSVSKFSSVTRAKLVSDLHLNLHFTISDESSDRVNWFLPERNDGVICTFILGYLVASLANPRSASIAHPGGNFPKRVGSLSSFSRCFFSAVDNFSPFNPFSG